MERSGLGKLDWKDLANGFITAALGSLVASAMDILNGGFKFTWDIWQPALAGAVVAGLGYLLKRLFSNEQGQFLSK